MRELAQVLLVALASSVITSAVWAGKSQPQFDPERYAQFIQELDKFNRIYEGCDMTGYPPDLMCNPGVARFDAKRWQRITKEGKELFQ